jgi:hypothetical protein
VQPRTGPVIFRLAALSDVSITAAGGTLGPYAFRFPRSLFITGISIVPRSGARGDMAALSLRIQDQKFQDMIADGAGGHFASVLSLMGTTPLATAFSPLVLYRPFKLQRPVFAGDEWYFTIQNNSAGTAIKTETILYFDEGEAP